ncbi:precorrin-3B C(17)-methyltransferase [Frisingicoccus sp.]|uniref:precorrin-3B C(17)-methyltransferase n=1 Tax=Frisingicoccus sp. TaxID=1918627 RepID=UPI00399A4F7B
MTVQAIAAMKAADVLVVYTTYIDLIKDIFPDKNFLNTPMTREAERCRIALEEAKKGKQVALISSGDSGIYGMAGIMLQIVQASGEDIPVRIIPGVTAASTGASMLGAPLMNDFAIISLSDLMVPLTQIMLRVKCAAEGDFVICLYNPKSRKRKDYLEKAADIIMTYRKPETPVGIVRRAGRENSSCEVTTLKELKNAEVDMFTIVIIGNSMTYVRDGKIITPRGYVLEEV